MKQYGAMKATEFTRKQISMIYAKANSGELAVEKWYISKLYDLADYYSYDYNGSVAYHEFFIKKIINAVFENNIEEAQRLINEDTEREYNAYSYKQKSKFDRKIIG